MHSLLAYSIEVRELRGTEAEILSNIEGHDFYDWVLDVLNDASQEYITVNNRLYITEIHEADKQKRTIRGCFKSGESGYTSQLVDIESKKPKHNRAVTEAEIVPLSFYFEIDENSSKAFAILQKHSQNSVKSVVEGLIQAKVRSTIDRMRLHMNPVLDKQAFSKMIDEGNPKQIRFVKYNIPEDITDQAAQWGTEDEIGVFEVRVHARRDRILSRLGLGLKQNIQDGFKDQSMFELMDDTYDKIKVEVEIDGRKRWIDATNPGHLRTEFSLDEESGINFHDGHPDMDQVHGYSQEIINNLKGTV